MVSTTTLKHALRTGRAAKLPFPVHPHMLRHATGYKLANDGHDTRSLAHYLGHRNLQSTVTAALQRQHKPATSLTRCAACSNGRRKPKMSPLIRLRASTIQNGERVPAFQRGPRRMPPLTISDGLSAPKNESGAMSCSTPACVVATPSSSVASMCKMGSP